MDRQIVWAGAIPLETDILNSERNALVAIGSLAAALFGSSTIADGLACAPTAPASMSVQVGAGRLYVLDNVDDSAFSSLAADTTHQILKQGISLDPVTLACSAPTTAGQSVSYLIQATFSEVDANAAVLPYYNSSDPTQAFSGPGNTGQAQPTVRRGEVVLSAKAGVAAATGSQTVPAADVGYVGLWVVTVAYGASTITSGAIAKLPGAPILPTGGLVAAVQTAALTFAIDTGAASAIVANLSPPPATLSPGMIAVVKVAASNAGAATLSLNGFGAKSVTYAGQAVAANMMRAGQIYSFAYDGTNWQLLNPYLSGQSQKSDFINAGTFSATVPAWATQADIELTGGGGAGGACG